MDTEKLTEVEMKELMQAEVQDDKDAEKDKMEGTKETEKKAEEKEKKEKEIKEKGNVYSKLKNPTEDMYSTAVSTSSPKRNEDVYRRVVLYKRISVVLTILSVLLLAVVIALAMKLYEGQSIQSCPERPEAKQLNATRQVCQNMYPSTQAVPGCQCSECGKGWVKLQSSCYFISKERLSWQESREACQKLGGDLIVIKNEYVQKTLTKYWGMLYWIGLRYSEKQQWMWINNSAVTQSYWAHGQPEPDTQDSCALLRGKRAPMKNWHSNPCVVSSQYICQRG